MFNLRVCCRPLAGVWSEAGLLQACCRFLNELQACCSRKRFSPGTPAWEKSFAEMKTLLTLSTLKILSVCMFISLPLFLSFMNCTGDWGFFLGFCSRLYIDKYVDTRTFTSDTNLIFENFFLERNRLMAKITKNKKFLKLVKEYIQIFSGWFEQFFYFEKKVENFFCQP